MMTSMQVVRKALKQAQSYNLDSGKDYAEIKNVRITKHGMLKFSINIGKMVDGKPVFRTVKCEIADLCPFN